MGQNDWTYAPEFFEVWCLSLLSNLFPHGPQVVLLEIEVETTVRHVSHAFDAVCLTVQPNHFDAAVVEVLEGVRR